MMRRNKWSWTTIMLAGVSLFLLTKVMRIENAIFSLGGE